jgi:hypothetical protein
MYYTLSLVVAGSSTNAYYGITPTSNLQIAQGGASLAPAAAAATLVNVYPQEFQVQAPAGSFNGAVVIVTNEDAITGTFGVSPEIDVAVVLTAYGAGGRKLGEQILDPGTSMRPFSFPVNAAEGMSEQGAMDELKALLGKKV